MNNLPFLLLCVWLYSNAGFGQYTTYHITKTYDEKDKLIEQDTLIINHSSTLSQKDKDRNFFFAIKKRNSWKSTRDFFDSSKYSLHASLSLMSPMWAESDSLKFKVNQLSIWHNNDTISHKVKPYLLHENDRIHQNHRLQSLEKQLKILTEKLEKLSQKFNQKEKATRN